MEGRLSVGREKLSGECRGFPEDDGGKGRCLARATELNRSDMGGKERTVIRGELLK